MSNLTWLHLSDIHFSPDSIDIDQDKIVDELIEQINREALEGIKPEFIFITGDIADKGKDYTKAINFLDRLLKITQLEKECLFIVPGNHDVDLEQNKLFKKALFKIRSDKEKAKKFINSTDIRQLGASFHAYEEFFNNYFSGVRRFSSNQPYYIYQKKIPLNGSNLKIGIVGLNTCWFFIDKEDMGNLWIGDQYYKNAFNALDRPDVIFVLHHHPLFWLNEVEHRDIEVEFTQNEVISLYGHLHHPHAEFIKNQYGETLRFRTGSVQDKKEYFQHAFWGTLDFNNMNVAIKPIRYESSGGNPGWHLYQSFFKGDNIKKFPFPDQSLKKIKAITSERDVEYEFKDIIKNLRDKRLLFQRKNLKAIPSEIGDLSNLEDLILSNNSIEYLDPKISNLKKLKLLDLRGNQLKNLPDEMKGLLNLEKLYLSSNRLEGKGFTPEIWNLLEIEEIKLQHNKIDFLPEIKNELKNLRSLELHDNLLEKLPPGLEKLNNLKDLRLKENKLTELPPEIGGLKNLQKLYLNDNQLKELPSQIEKLDKLEELEVSNNKLGGKLTSKVGKLDKLKHLEIEGNQLTELPSEIGGLKNLQKLFLNNNQLIELPSEIGGLKNLQKLYLNDNQLKGLPPTIVELTELKLLDLSDNEIDEIPSDNIGKLKKLEVLKLSNNKLSKLPPKIIELENLQKLYLDGNILIEFPSSIGNLCQLNRLELDDYQINQFSSVIKELPNFSKLYCRGKLLSDFCK